MADTTTDPETDARKQELIDKVNKLVETKFAGDRTRAFEHYAKASGGASGVEKSDLVALLGDAEVGNRLTRGLYADAIMAAVDTSADGTISRAELDATFGP
jgi:hypothetical protein